MSKRSRKDVPALQNEEVTGMTKSKQERVIEKSGRAPRDEAAEEFIEEQEKEARNAPSKGHSGKR